MGRGDNIDDGLSCLNLPNYLKLFPRTTLTDIRGGVLTFMGREFGIIFMGLWSIVEKSYERQKNFGNFFPARQKFPC
jgi:hypothetical protein